MNAVAPAQQTVAQPVNRNVGVAKALAQLQANILDPIEQEPWGETFVELLRKASFLPDGRLFPDRVRRDVWCKAREILAAAPDGAEMKAFGAAINSALDAEPDRAQAKLVIGMLLDAFPAGRPPNLAAYADSILHDLVAMRFRPAAVVMGCQSVRRNARFLPAVSEIIEACHSAQEELIGREYRHARLSSILNVARAVAALPEPTPEQ